MNKIIILLLLVIVSFKGGAQTKQPIIASAQYRVTYTKNGQVTINDICQLDISKENSYFFSTGELENKRRIAAQYEKAKSANTPLKMSYGDYLHQLCPFKIYKEYSQKRALYVQDINGQNLAFVVDTLSSRRWKLENESTKIGNITCHKATMKKDTIEITAWFATDIPFRDGPNYFYGLPGLILRATTNTGFSIDFLSIKYNTDTKKVMQTPSYTLVKPAQMQRAMHNQDASFRQGRLPNGGEIKQLSGN